jgi:hypothetical protein
MPRSNGTENRTETAVVWPTLAELPVPVKVLLSMILLTLALAMVGALGQIIVHDIIPIFFAGEEMPPMPSTTGQRQVPEVPASPSSRGDLFATDAVPAAEPAHQPLYQEEQFVWLLKWTHIHLFGMSTIFIFLGVVTVFLNMSARARGWIVALPFAGAAMDIAAMWLKVYVSPAFFWLHVPGGGLFTIIFIFVFLRAMQEMWRQA